MIRYYAFSLSFLLVSLLGGPATELGRRQLKQES